MHTVLRILGKQLGFATLVHLDTAAGVEEQLTLVKGAHPYSYLHAHRRNYIIWVAHRSKSLSQTFTNHHSTSIAYTGCCGGGAGAGMSSWRFRLIIRITYINWYGTSLLMPFLMVLMDATIIGKYSCNGRLSFIASSHANRGCVTLTIL